MAHSVIQQGDTVDYGVIQCVCDLKTDIAGLPTSDWKAGSSVLCIEDSSIYILGSDKIWHEV